MEELGKVRISTLGFQFLLINLAYSDMMDRIAFRKHIEAELSWKEPLGDRPDWRVWRSNMDVKGIPEHGGQNDPPNICRAMRAFMAKKPTKSPEAKT